MDFKIDMPADEIDSLRWEHLSDVRNHEKRTCDDNNYFAYNFFCSDLVKSTFGYDYIFRTIVFPLRAEALKCKGMNRMQRFICTTKFPMEILVLGSGGEFTDYGILSETREKYSYIVVCFDFEYWLAKNKRKKIKLAP